jgi:hypothetical protein
MDKCYTRKESLNGKLWIEADRISPPFVNCMMIEGTNRIEALMEHSSADLKNSLK